MDSESENESPPEAAETGRKLPPAAELGLVLLAFAFAVGAIFHLVNRMKAVDAEAEQEVQAMVQAENAGPEEKRTKGPWGLAVERPRNVKLTGFHNFWDRQNDIRLWWDDIPLHIQTNSVRTFEDSNVKPDDYAGVESCRKCHVEKYNDWHQHSHRLMNALATAENVRGDFSGSAKIDYLGGTGRFYQENGGYRMALKRDLTTRVYAIERTIGSRFTQYYVGKLIEGSEPADSPMWKVQHVLPFGYWITEKQWVPTVHVFRESNTDKENQDPYTEQEIVSYDGSCTACHVTLAGGDWILNLAGGQRLSAFSPRSVAFDAYGYLKDARPDLLGGKTAEDVNIKDIFDLGQTIGELPAIDNAVSLGITCEACHFGAKQHAQRSTKDKSEYAPPFYPAGPHVYASGANREEVLGRNRANLTFACARCHSGGRPEYANGNHTWNSTEFSDAIYGFCYDPKGAKEHGMNELTCIHCHDPHKATGLKWNRTLAEDNQSCIACHAQFKDAAKLTGHTHHAADSTGSGCMNCHMPKINEGLQDMVRTHRIFNPTEPSMIENNQPNACNLCHLKENIDWTIRYLREWYGDEHTYSEAKLTANYPQRSGPVALGWIRGTHAPTRLAAAEALAKSGEEWGRPHLLDLLVVDDNLVHRQFVQKRLEEELNVDFDALGYHFYMMQPERQAAIDKLRPVISGKKTAAK